MMHSHQQDNIQNGEHRHTQTKTLIRCEQNRLLLHRQVSGPLAQKAGTSVKPEKPVKASQWLPISIHFDL